ncbi:MAG: type IV pilus modification protein PilV [Desulfobacterales bacterium]|uniref:Type IV pilus modification protein PilV n=1 Tax=Candidatus Desulfaltia bathyphila TaxID=2841697 RepID=A0A8J6N687_9BACT|nr:type IV pilus modification protein PilV [Candidatus Desulfaltia bathyphila]MBL7195156.1 type IV pilus modification protein PilV [Desulfobacterales bacterium]MBL7208293.1 type IV pilus modification protein PilV [Desulfobacterales bacterium]
MIHHNYDNQRPEVTPRLRSSNGFTLMEVLVAMLILSVGLLGMAALITGIINSNKLSNRISTATVLAQDKMEKIRGVGYDDAEDEDGTEDYNNISNYLLYKRITAVAAGDPAAGMKKITVTVYWDSDDHSVVLNTILAE